jgi:hypothetical protein
MTPWSGDNPSGVAIIQSASVEAMSQSFPVMSNRSASLSMMFDS